MTTDFISCPLTAKEKKYGLVWLMFEVLFFPLLLELLNGILPAPLPQVEVNFIFFVVNFIAVVWIFHRYLNAQLGLVPDLIEKILLVALPGFLIYRLVNLLLTMALFAADPDFASINDMTVQSLARENYFLMLIGSVILVPIAEECLFRGLVFRGMYDHSPLLAWVVSILLFSAIHVTGYIGQYSLPTILLCFAQYIPAGACLAGAYRISGSLLSPILIHALVNFVGMLALR